MKKYTMVIGLLMLFGFAVTGVQAQNGFSKQRFKPATQLERTPKQLRLPGAGQRAARKGGKAKVPSSMDLFVDRCTSKGGGLISIDGHYDCVKPSGEPIPNW